MNKLIRLTLLVSLMTPFSMGVWAADDLVSSQLVDEARQWEAKGRDDLAADVWQKILISNPQHGEALVNLGLIKAQEGNLDEAQRLYSHARKLRKAPSGLSKLTAILANPSSSVKPFTFKSSSIPIANASTKASEPLAKRNVPLQAKSIGPQIAYKNSGVSQTPSPAALVDDGIKPAEISKNVVLRPRPCRIPLPPPTQI